MLSQHELEIMKLLWTEGRGLTPAEIVALTPDRSWKSSSIHALINKLLHNDAIEMVGVQQSGKVYARVFAAKLSQEEYAGSYLDATLSEHANLAGVFSALADRRSISEETLDALHEMIQEKKRSFVQK